MMEQLRNSVLLVGNTSFALRLQKIMEEFNYVVYLDPDIDNSDLPDEIDVLIVPANSGLEERIVTIRNDLRFLSAIPILYSEVIEEDVIEYAFHTGIMEFLSSNMSDAEMRIRIGSCIRQKQLMEESQSELDMVNTTMGQMEGVLLEFENMSLEISVLNDSLHEEVAERKKVELSLRESEKQLMEANATKDRFFSIIAHDLKNPFNALIGLSNILLSDFDEFEDQEKKGLISEIKSASQRTYDLLQELLEWSRSQMGSIKLNYGWLNVLDLVDSAVLPLSAQAGRKEISIITEIDENIQIYADLNTVTTVIRNLVSNSIKFTNSNGKITVCSAINDGVVRISVKDDGVGMSEKDIDMLFKIDSHFKTKGTSNERGTGLGLILCKEFIDKNNGRIWAESKLGLGSEFMIEIKGSKMIR